MTYKVKIMHFITIEVSKTHINKIHENYGANNYILIDEEHKEIYVIPKSIILALTGHKFKVIPEEDEK